VLLVYSLLLTLPIILLKVVDIPIGLIDVISLAGIFNFIRRPLESKIHTSFLACILSSLLFLSLSDFFYFKDRDSLTSSLFSLAYFFKPYFAYFAGLSCIKQSSDLKKIFKSITLGSIIVVFFYSLTSIQSGGSRNVDALLNISFLEIYGSVNHKEAYFATLTSLLMYLLINSKALPFFKQILISTGILLGIYTAFSSGSRSSILLLLATLLFASTTYVSFSSLGRLFSLSRENIGKLLIIVATVALIVYVFAQGIIPIGMLMAKLELNSSSLDSNQFGEITAGRDKIYATMIEDIFQQPIFGAAFHGFSAASGYDGSPHNQILGSLWKMGVFSFVFYLQFIGRIFNRINLSDRRMDTWIELKFVKILCISYAIALMPNQDTLTFPQTGVFIMFLCGCAVGCSDIHFSHSKRNLYPSFDNDRGDTSGIRQ
jgi:hypothetical protein